MHAEPLIQRNLEYRGTAFQGEDYKLYRLAMAQSIGGSDPHIVQESTIIIIKGEWHTTNFLKNPNSLFAAIQVWICQEGFLWTQNAKGSGGRFSIIDLRISILPPCLSHLLFPGRLTLLF